jgi:hypothetical protein
MQLPWLNKSGLSMQLRFHNSLPAELGVTSSSWTDNLVINNALDLTDDLRLNNSRIRIRGTIDHSGRDRWTNKSETLVHSSRTSTIREKFLVRQCMATLTRLMRIQFCKSKYMVRNSSIGNNIHNRIEVSDFADRHSSRLLVEIPKTSSKWVGFLANDEIGHSERLLILPLLFERM